MAEKSNGKQHRWWAQESPATQVERPRFRAVAYYRHSAQDRQENSVAIQQEHALRHSVYDLLHPLNLRLDLGQQPFPFLLGLATLRDVG